MIPTLIRNYRWPLALASVAFLIGGTWSIGSSAPPAPDVRRPAATATAPARSTAIIPPRVEDTREGANAAAALPTPASPEVAPADPDQGLAMDPSEQFSSTGRIAQARDILDRFLRAPATGSEASDDLTTPRLQAAVALTTLRAELGATESGRSEVLDYAARLRAIPAR